MPYISVGRLKDARPLQKEAVQLAEASAHPDLSKLRVALCRIHLELGEPVEALPYMEEFLAVEQTRLGAPSRQMANMLATRGQNLLDHGQFAAAEELLQECQKFRDGDKKERDAWPTFSSRALIGLCRLGQGEPADAEPLMLDGYEGMFRAKAELTRRKEKVPEHLDRRLGEASDTLIRLYIAWGEPAEAAKWLEERKRYPLEQLPPPRADK